MKNLLKLTTIGLIAFSVTACRHSAKETEMLTKANNIQETVKDEIVKDVFTDNFGDKIEVSTNNTKNTAIIYLGGKTYELKKAEGLPEYTASNSEYQYSNINGNIVFLKKNVDMVLFHSKAGKKESTKMASF